MLNIMSDGMVRVPDEATLISLAGTQTDQAFAEYPKDVELYESETTHAIKIWLRMIIVDLTEEETEAVVITDRWKGKKG